MPQTYIRTSGACRGLNSCFSLPRLLWIFRIECAFRRALKYNRMRKFAPLAAALLFGASIALADDLEDASRLLKAGQAQQALESVNKALAAKPRDPQARFLKGLILTEQGNAREAIDVFTRLTQDYPDLPEPFNNLAEIYASQGEYDKARVSLERSIRTHPSYATAYE